MSENNARKSAARRLAKTLGISYVHALRLLNEGQQNPKPDTPALAEALLSVIEGSLRYAEVEDPSMEHSSGVPFGDVPMPYDVDNITVQHVDPDPATLDWAVDETFDQTTMAITVTVQAEVSFEAYMHRSDYWGRTGSEDDDVSATHSDVDLDDIFVEVAFSRLAKLTYSAVVETAGPDVESLEFAGAVAVS